MSQRLPGRPAKYRGKLPKPVKIYLTPEGHAALAEGMRAENLSLSDYVEKKLRRARPQPATAPDREPDSEPVAV